MRNASMTMSVAFAAFVVFVSFSTPVFAQETEDIEEPLPFEELNLNGTWNFSTPDLTVSGGCPAGSPVSGTAAVTQQGTELTLQYVSGARCDPAAVCSYTGTIDKESNELVFTNSVTVDDDRGTVTSAIVLAVYNNELMDGDGTNHYVHPQGFECQWNMELVFSREPEEGLRK
jgi:hypothetical protein